MFSRQDTRAHNLVLTVLFALVGVVFLADSRWFGWIFVVAAVLFLAAALGPARDSET